MQRIQNRMREHVQAEFAESWRTSMRAALKANLRPDFLFDVNSIMHPAFCADKDLRITGWSKAFEDLFGVPNGIDIFTFFRLFDLHVFDTKTTRVDPARHVVDAMREGLAEKGAVNQLPAFLRLDGSYEFLEISCVIQKPYEGVQSIMPISKDLRVLRELRDQEQQFAASIYHDFNTPLLGLSFRLSDLLTRDGAKRIPDVVQPYLQQMLDTVSFLQNSLALYESYPDQGASTVFNPILVVDRILPVARVLHQDINFDESFQGLGPGIYLASGTRYWFQQALQNVIRNAVEAIHARQAAHDKARGEITISAAERGSTSIVISIRDNGCGMSPEVLEKLTFPQPLTTKGVSHQGIGLTILRRVTEMAGGFSPEFESTLDVGTTVHIPLAVIKSRPTDE